MVYSLWMDFPPYKHVFAPIFRSCSCVLSGPADAVRILALSSDSAAHEGEFYEKKHGDMM